MNIQPSHFLTWSYWQIGNVLGMLKLKYFSSANPGAFTNSLNYKIGTVGKKYQMAHIQSIWLTCCTVEPTCRKICLHAIPNGSHTVSNGSYAVPNGLYTVPCTKTLNGSQFMHDWFCQIRQINLIISRNSHYKDVNTSTHCCTKICWHLNWSTIEHKFTMDRPIRSTTNV